MNRFIKNILRFSFFVIAVSCIISLTVYYGFLGKENRPALNFTDSYSYNEKLLFLKNQSYKPDIVSLGSSMTLGNLHSEVVIKELNSEKYLNASSWGMRMEESFNLIKALNSIYDLNKLIIVSNVVDFQKSAKRVDYDFINSYLNNNWLKTILFTIKNFNISYYWENIAYSKFVRTSRHDYQSLHFDKFGMVRHNKDSFIVSKERWTNNFMQYGISKIEYSYLDSIARFCSQNKIELYFFQSPYREGLKNNFTQKERDILDMHVSKVGSILQNRHHFVNSNNINWNDSLFIDGIHFNETGSAIFTKYCFDQIADSSKIKTHDP